EKEHLNLLLVHEALAGISDQDLRSRYVQHGLGGAHAQRPSHPTLPMPRAPPALSARAVLDAVLATPRKHTLEQLQHVLSDTAARISHHLEVLIGMDLIDTERQGGARLYFPAAGAARLVGMIDARSLHPDREWVRKLDALDLLLATRAAAQPTAPR
ncbi:MAG: hypothetical protein ACRDQ0_21040, partial [Pseudonocardia sp.]